MFECDSDYNLWPAVKSNTVVWLFLCRLLKHVKCSASLLGIQFQGKNPVLYTTFAGTRSDIPDEIVFLPTRKRLILNSIQGLFFRNQVDLRGKTN